MAVASVQSSSPSFKYISPEPASRPSEAAPGKVDFKKINVIIIGGGPGGYPTAGLLAKHGFNVSCIDMRENGNPGGVCLNVGCIPSKAFLHTSDLHHASGTTDKPDIQANLLERKEAVVSHLAGGLKSMFSATGVKYLQGHGQLLNDRRIQFTPAGEDNKPQILNADYVVLAPGSKPIDIPPARINGKQIVDSTGALEFKEVPKRFAVIGAGAIGLEMAVHYARLGSKVTIFEASNTFLPSVDSTISRKFQDYLKKEKNLDIDIRVGTKVTGSKVDEEQDNVSISFHDKKGQQTLTADRLLVAAGRKPNTQGLVSEESGVKLTQSGHVAVDDYCRTDAPNVFAIGDAVRGPALAHKAESEGKIVAEMLSGKPVSLDENGKPAFYKAIPFVTYTGPDMAGVGKTEQALKAEGYKRSDYKVGTLPLTANGMAVASEAAHGIVKVLVDKKSDKILGVHVLSPHAGEVISTAVAWLHEGKTAREVEALCLPHPTLTEALRNAVENAR